MVIWLTVIAAIVCVALIALSEFWLALLPYALAQNAATRGNHRAAIQIYELVLRRRTLVGWMLRYDLPYRLAWSYLANKQPNEGIRHLNTLLERKLRPATQAMVRRRLAECFDSAGQKGEARDQMNLANSVLQSAPVTPEQIAARGIMIAQEKRFAEACDLYKRALGQMTSRSGLVRGPVMARLALASFNAGRPDDAIKWANEAITGGISDSLLHVAHSAAALGHSAKGELDLAEQQWGQAIEVASRNANSESVARYLGILAGIKRKRGQIHEALRMCDEAVSKSLSARRVSKLVEFDCYRALGLWSEARIALNQAAASETFHVPSSERRSDALFELAFAWLCGEEGKAADGLQHLERADAELMREDKMRVSCLSTGAWLYALMNNGELTGIKLAEAENAAAAIPESRSTQLSYHAMCGRASIAISDFAGAIVHLRTYISLSPDPVEIPKCHYYLGEALLGSGDPGSAIEEFRTAVGTNIEVLHTRLARERLATLGAGIATGV